MDNIKKLQKAEIEENRIGKGKDRTAVHNFGFPAVTCCGYIGQNNEWCDDWVVSDDINCSHGNEIILKKGRY